MNLGDMPEDMQRQVGTFSAHQNTSIQEQNHASWTRAHEDAMRLGFLTFRMFRSPQFSRYTIYVHGPEEEHAFWCFAPICLSSTMKESHSFFGAGHVWCYSAFPLPWKEVNLP